MSKPLDDYLRTVELECERQGLEQSYVLAIVAKESSGNRWATRYEPGWSYFENPAYWANRLGQSEETEINGQKISWGLMQVMGGTARWLGFSGYLPELCVPDVGVHYGCMLLARKLRKYGNYPAAIAAYNAGSVVMTNNKFSNQSYVDDVLRIRKESTIK